MFLIWRIRNTLREFLKLFNLAVIRADSLPGILARGKFGYDAAFLNLFDLATRVKLERLLDSSKSQLRQDLFVLSILNFKKNGFLLN